MTLRSNFEPGTTRWAMRRAQWTALGLSDEDMQKPKIAIVNSSSGLASCFSHLDGIVPPLKDASLGEIARKYGKKPAQIILRWNLQHGVVPIPKAYRDDHQRENLGIFDFMLDEGDMATLDGLNQHFSALEKLDYLPE